MASSKRIVLTPNFWLMVVFIFGFSIPIFMAVRTTIDYVIHVDLALYIDENGLGSIGHFLYHVLFLSLYYVFPNTDLSILAIIPVILAIAMVGLTIYFLLTLWFSDTISPWHRQLLTLSILVTAPVFIWFDNFHLIGYLNFNAYHNPTQNISKLFVIPVSMLALRSIYPHPYSSQRKQYLFIGVSVVLILLMALSKPNYIIVLLPTLALFTLHHLIKRQPIDWLLLIFGIVLPAVIILVLQYMVMYGKSDDSGIAFGPLIVMKQLIPVNRIIPQLLLSILFPLFTYLLHWRTAKETPYLNFLWVMFLISLFYTYFLYETGARQDHGNFLWSSYITLFVLMFASVIFVLKTYREQFAGENKVIPIQLVIVTLLYGLHLTTGISYYVKLIMR